MKSVREVMSQDIITIHPSSSVKSAIILMQGHEVGVLPVVTDEALLGIVETHDLLGRDPDQRVSEVMCREFQSISPETQIRRAAEMMARSGQMRLLVEEDGQLVGIVTAMDLLPDLGKSLDPVTGLPWSDTLREWSFTALAGGSEVAVLFFDVDLFGQFNKQYGHVVGDAVLKGIASLLSQLVNPETDMLCRVGGDEFVISSIRPRDEALNLAKQARDRVSHMRLEDVDSPITISYGLAGGRRTKEREEIHYAATFNDLLNRASQECMAMKRETRPEAEAPAAPVPDTEPGTGPAAQIRPRLRIEQIRYTSSDSEISVEIVLSLAGRTFRQTLSGFPGIAPLMRLSAEVCAAAAQQCLAGDERLAVEDIREFQTPGSEPLMLATVVLASPREASRYYGLAPVRKGDTHRAAAASVLSALNRPLGLLLDR